MAKNRVVVGIHACKETIKVRGEDVGELYLRQGWKSHHSLNEVAQLAQNSKINIIECGENKLNKFASSHQGVALTVSSEPELDWSELKSADKSIILALDGLEDPHNLGAILRTAWLMGVDAALVPEHKSVGLTPIVSKVACGGAEYVPLLKDGNLTQRINELKEIGYWVYGLSHEANSDLWQSQLPEKIVWVIGAEDKGIRKSVQNTCDQLVSIPQKNSRASYNASVATAIALAETRRQLQTP